jgi:hypothetical protein
MNEALNKCKASTRNNGMNRLIAAVFVASLVPLTVFASPKSTITGQVTDPIGAAVQNARVLVHWDPSGSSVGLTDNVGIKEDIVVVTDTDGHYSVDVPAGFYDVFVSAMAFTPTATKVRVKENHTTTFAAKLKPDALVTKELGDEIKGGGKIR